MHCVQMHPCECVTYICVRVTPSITPVCTQQQLLTAPPLHQPAGRPQSHQPDATAAAAAAAAAATSNTQPRCNIISRQHKPPAAATEKRATTAGVQQAPHVSCVVSVEAFHVCPLPFYSLLSTRVATGAPAVTLCHDCNARGIATP